MINLLFYGGVDLEFVLLYVVCESDVRGVEILF